MEKHDITSFSLKSENDELKLRKGREAPAFQGMWPSQQPPAQFAPPVSLAPSASELAGNAASPSAPAAPAPGTMINSPMVGTFYRAASPTDEPFVKEGDRVTPDTVVCIIEAMKVMNEIKAECSGIVKTVHAEESKPVQYGQPLFELQP